MNKTMSKNMAVWVGVSISKTMSVSMSLIVNPSDSVIIKISVSINLNASSSLGIIRYKNISKRISFKVNPSDSR